MPASRWEAALAEHRAALDGYAAAVEALDAEGWTRPRAAGKWSPAEITEHLALTYRAFLRELREGEPMKMRVRGWRLPLLRWLLLPHILFHRSFPRGAVSPRELRPEAPGTAPAEALAALRAVAAECEAEIASARARPGAVVTHPYFGGIELTRALKFQAVHVEHHTRQVREAAHAPS